MLADLDKNKRKVAPVKGRLTSLRIIAFWQAAISPVRDTAISFCRAATVLYSSGTFARTFDFVAPRPPVFVVITAAHVAPFPWLKNKKSQREPGSCG
jgi:hypothetical protein